MANGRSDCLVCGRPLVYSPEAYPTTCALCGKQGESQVTCEGGHYVCDTCHRKQGVDHIVGECLRETGVNPVEIANRLMAHASIYPNGPEHHTLAGAVLLCAYRNAGGGIDLPAAMEELVRRSMQVPGGACGYWGCCGAAVSAGQFYSIVSGSTPLAGDEWGAAARLTSRVLARLADYGGPRCCKRSTYVAMQVAVPYVRETLGASMELPDTITCRFFPYNAECLRDRCPFFPQGAIHPDDRA